MAVLLILKLILRTCLLLTTEIFVAHSLKQETAKGCPLLNPSNVCNGKLVYGQRSTVGNFNDIGSIIHAWYGQQQYYLRCLEDGTYNETRSCLRVDQAKCSTFIYKRIEHLLMNPPNATLLTGRVLSFTCESGFRLEGTASIYCKSNDTWSDNTKPACKVCSYPGPLENGYYTDSKDNIYKNGGSLYNETVTGHCNQDYKIQGNQQLTCQRNGEWSSVSQKCVAASCGPPNLFPPLNGNYVFPNGSYPLPRKFQIGDKLILKCKRGFSLLGNDYITCSKGGSWLNQQFSLCQPVNCKDPLDVKNGNYYLKINSHNQTYSGIPVPYGSSIYVSCLDGFFNDGITKLECNENGTWTGDKPTCTKITCNLSLKVENGWYEFNLAKISIPTTFQYKEQIYVHCNDGYVLKTHPQRTCIKLNEWSGPKPICDKIFCSMPMRITNGYYKDEKGDLLTQRNIEFNSNITFHCKTGYKMTEGTFTRRCDASGKWNGSNPSCSPITCNKPDEKRCGYYIISGPKDLSLNQETQFSSNTTLLFVCNDTNYSCINITYKMTCLADGNWHGNTPSCEVKQEFSNKEDNKDTHSDAITWAVCGVVSVLVIGVSIFVFLIIWKRRNGLCGNKHDDERQSFRNLQTNSNENEMYINGDSVHISDDSNSATTDTHGDTNSVYINTLIEDLSKQTYYDFRNTESLPKTAIKVNDLQDILFNGQNVNKIFEKQFMALPQGMVENFSEAVKLKNKGKNRYTRLYAYDDTRVVLNTDEESSSDYINACYVHGFNKSRKYIATQGPTKNTTEDFWRMVWQEDSSKIVMLTKLIEEGRNKCMKYWPEDNKESYGNLKVCLKKVETHSQFDVRTLSVQKRKSAEKMVTQFHFTVWPDKGIPRYASALVHFLKKVNNAPEYGCGPIIVHCSAGVGRTGTYIALDYLTDQGKTLGYVDVAGCVDALRRQRVNLVQTVDQYIFLHRALVESLTMSSSTIPAHNFEERYCELQLIDPNKNKTRISIDYENLQRVSPQSEDSLYVSAKLALNRQKNRDPSILPVEDFMPFLTNNVGKPTYINAVFLSSYNEKNAFIITQSPLASTREDFWNLVWQQEVHTIVMLNASEELKDDEIYWPDEKPAIFGNTYVSSVSTDTINDHSVLTLSTKKNNTIRRIKQIQCGGWPKGNILPNSPNIILSLLDTVQAWQRQTGNHKILVHCMNGADRSGLFCVISSVIERMKIEKDVAISSVVEEMRNARVQIIPCLEQYQFCHEVVLHFIQQYETYSNFQS